MVENLEVNHAPLDEREIIVPYLVDLSLSDVQSFIDRYCHVNIGSINIIFNYKKSAMEKWMELLNSTSEIDRNIYQLRVPPREVWSKIGKRFKEAVHTSFFDVEVVCPAEKQSSILVDLGKIYCNAKSYVGKSNSQALNVCFFDSTVRAIAEGFGQINYPNDRNSRREYCRLIIPLWKSILKVEPLQII